MTSLRFIKELFIFGLTINSFIYRQSTFELIYYTDADFIEDQMDMKSTSETSVFERITCFMVEPQINFDCPFDDRSRIYCSQ
jgi:hypothetical protein